MKNNKSLLTRVQEALAKDSKLKACLDKINILVNDGTAIVAGSATDDSLRGLAEPIVSSGPGVNLLIDDLRVEPAQPHRVGVQIDWDRDSITLV